MIILPQCNGLPTTTIWCTTFSKSLRTVLKLLNVHKACSDLDKGPALSWQLNLSLLLPIQWLSHDLISCSRVNCERHRGKESSILNTRNHVWNNSWRKSWGVVQEVSHSHNVWQNRNEITQFTPELWFYDAFWLTSTNILKLVGNVRSSSGRFFCTK